MIGGFDFFLFALRANHSVYQRFFTGSAFPPLPGRVPQGISDGSTLFRSCAACPAAGRARGTASAAGTAEPRAGASRGADAKGRLNFLSAPKFRGSALA